MGFFQDIGKRPVERPERVRLVSSAISTTDVFNSFVMSCSTAMFFLSNTFAYVIIRAPGEFVPAHLIDKKIWEIRPRRAMPAPFLLVGFFNLICGYVTHQLVQPLTGNVMGFLCNSVFGLSLFALTKVTWLYPAMGCIYTAFGFLHHYRRLGVLTDNSPLFNWSDFSDIREYRQNRHNRKYTHEDDEP